MMPDPPLLAAYLTPSRTSALTISKGFRSRLKGAMAEIMASMELDLHGFLTAVPITDMGLDIIAYRKSTYMAVQVKSPTVIKQGPDEISLQYTIERDTLKALKEDPGLMYCLVIAAEQVPSMGIHFAWIPGKLLWDFFMNVFHKRATTLPPEITLRLKASPDGRKLYYTYYKKERHDLSAHVDIVPVGAWTPYTGIPWHEHAATYAARAAGSVYVKWAKLELMAREMVPTENYLDQGVDLTVLDTDSAPPRYISYQVKGLAGFERARNGWRMGFHISQDTIDRLEGLDVHHIILMEDPEEGDRAWERRRRFLTIPAGDMARILDACPVVKKRRKDWPEPRPHRRLDIWMDKGMNEFWLEGKGHRKVEELTGYMDAWERII